MVKAQRQNSSRVQKSVPSTRKANAAGYSKRRSRSVKAVSGLSDVYDYEHIKEKRSNVSMTLDKEEAMGFGDDDNDEDDEASNRNRPRLIGENDDDEGLGSDEDEELDSDAAFEESDEERFAGFDFKRKNKAASKKTKSKKPSGSDTKKSVHFEVDLNEDEDGSQFEALSKENNDERDNDEEEEEESGEDDEFINVLDVLDGKGEAYFGDEDENSPQKDKNRESQVKNGTAGSVDEGDGRQRTEEEESEGDEDEDESEDDVQQISGDEMEADPDALDSLGDFVSKLETSSKRKAEDETDNTEPKATKKKKQRLLKDVTEAGVESEFGARAAGSGKLTIDDLLGPLASKSEELATLKKTMKPLAQSANPKNQALPVPLPQRSQEKLDREAAYEQTKQEVDKWTETMKRIKEAEHLSFPLQSQKLGKTSNLELAAKFKPSTELESSIDKLLKTAKLRDQDIERTEELMMNHLTVEEVVERRSELRKMRELMFRAELKAKRVAKIKSKAYRRIQKKKKEKLMSQLDEGGEGKDDEEERMKQEVERAKERATLKHKNTGKWAKAMKARGELDGDQRRDINEMLERGERLRNKIQGRSSDDENEESDDDFDGENGSTDKIRASAFEELERLDDADDGETQDAEVPQKAKSIFNMKFMKDAAARQSREVDNIVDDFRKEMAEIPEGDDNENVPDDENVAVERVGGRMTFRPGSQLNAGATKTTPLPPPPPSAISDTSTLKSLHATSPEVEFFPHETLPGLNFSEKAPAPPAEEENPWLKIGESSSSKLVRKRNELLVGKDSTMTQKSEAALKKQLKKSATEKEREKDDAVVEISTENVLVLSKEAGEKKRKKDRSKKKKKKVSAAAEDDADGGSDSGANSEVEEQEQLLAEGKGSKAFEQRDLVARAFAGDNVVRQFEEVKRREIEADAPREEDTTLPGWGSWGGAGSKKVPSKPHLIKKIAGIDPKSRTDYGKAHVIISERRDKKAAKYVVKDLPFPYTSKAQYEHRMEQPIGAEWNTRVNFQRATLPTVVKKMGTVIDPLEKLF